MQRVTVLGLAGCLLALSAHSEILQGIQPLDTLGDIQKRFPNATLMPVKAAWVQEDQAFYSLEGMGLPGKMRLAFDDSRPGWKKTLNKLTQKMSDDPQFSDTDKTFMEIAERQSQQPMASALTINWVRWIPDAPVPFERYKSKYGKPDRCGFSDADLTPFCEWKGKALTATLTDDQKAVLQVDSGFSRDEYRAAYMNKYNFVPDWLKESDAVSSPSGQQGKGKAPSRK